VDVSNPSNPSIEGWLSEPTVSDPRGITLLPINHFGTGQFYALVVSSQKLTMLNVTDPASPASVASNFDGSLTGALAVVFDAERSLAFVPASGLPVFAVPNPTTITWVGATSLGGVTPATDAAYDAENQVTLPSMPAHSSSLLPRPILRYRHSASSSSHQAPRS
jgi:hypothetical protein